MSLLIANFLIIKFSFMKKNVRIASDSEQKSIIRNAMQSSENEQLDLYKAIFGGLGSDCNVAAPSAPSDQFGAAEAAYDKTDTFLRAAV